MVWKGERNTMEHSRILIVDDNPEIREIIHVLLEGEGFLIEEAADGETALQLTMEKDFDLIILDIMMPGKNGYQTCVSIRKNCNAPVLFLSARTQDSDKTLGFSSGGDDYLAKPFSYNELISRSKGSKKYIRDPHCQNRKWKISELDSLIIHTVCHMHFEKDDTAVLSPGDALERLLTEGPLIRKRACLSLLIEKIYLDDDEITIFLR